MSHSIEYRRFLIFTAGWLAIVIAVGLARGAEAGRALQPLGDAPQTAQLDPR